MAPPPARATRRHGRLWRGLAYAFDAVTLVHATAVLAQPVFAGQLLSVHSSWLRVHELNGTAVIGVLAVAQLALAVALGVAGRGPAWPAAGTALVFAAEYVQADTGYAGRLGVHVPLGVAVFGGLLALVLASRRLFGPEREDTVEGRAGDR